MSAPATTHDAHEAFRQVVYDFGIPGKQSGPERLAPLMGTSVGTLYNKCNNNETSHHKPTLTDCIQATLFTGDKRIVKSICRTVGGVYLDLPDMSGMETDQLMTHILRIGREEGEFFRAIEWALKEDDRITPDEFKVIELEAHEFVAAVLESLQRMREMSGGAK